MQGAVIRFASCLSSESVFTISLFQNPPAPAIVMKTQILCLLLTSCLGLSASADTPKGLTDSDWASIRSAYEAGRHQFHRRDDGSHVAGNPGQGWTMEFDGRGFTAKPEGANWTWGLELEDAEVGAMKSEGNRLAVARGANLEEWFINDARGLEQGWTMKERPGDAGETVRLSLRVRGGLAPVSSERSVSFGDGMLTYGGLKAWDATGRVLAARFLPDGEKVVIEVEDSGAQYPVTIDPVAQQAYLKASNTEADDEFGNSVAVSGDTVVVGAPSEDSAATGVNGNNADNSANGSGAAYVFVRNAGGWTQQAYLKASNTGSGDQFGISVAVSGDTIVVGANDEDSSATGIDGNQADNTTFASGAAYVFVRSTAIWTQQAYLKASNTGANDRFGISVAVSGDTVVVGAIFESSAATGVNGNGADNSASGSGAAYVYQRTAGVWSHEAYLKASNTGADDRFGESVAVSGYTVVVGAWAEDSAATGIDGNGADNSASGSGAAYLFARNEGIWSQQAYLKASNTGAGDQFGRSVAVSGDTVVVGANGEGSAATGVDGDQADNSASGSGAAYVFVGSAGVWSQQAYLKASNTGVGDSFGWSVAISTDTIVVGALSESSAATGTNGDGTDNSASDAGAAYVFVRGVGVWSQQAYLKASNTEVNDYFGLAVAVSGDTIVVGAPEESSAATGVNGDGSNNNASQSGSAYVFLSSSTPPTPRITVVKKPKPFPPTRVGKTSRPQIVALRNSGDATLNGLRLTLEGSAKRDFKFKGRAAAPLAPNASTQVKVIFKPKRPGTRKATVSISGNIPSQSLKLSGKGLGK